MQLMTKADAEGRDAALDNSADGRDRVIAGFGIARAVRQEHAVRLERQRIRRPVACAGSTVTWQPRSASMRRMLRLMP